MAPAGPQAASSVETHSSVFLLTSPAVTLLLIFNLSRPFHLRPLSFQDQSSYPINNVQKLFRPCFGIL